MSCNVHRLITILTIVLSSTLLAQAPDTLWTRTYGGSEGDMLASVHQTADGGFIMAGGLAATGQGGDYWLVKTDAQGDPPSGPGPMAVTAGKIVTICK